MRVRIQGDPKISKRYRDVVIKTPSGTIKGSQKISSRYHQDIIKIPSDPIQGSQKIASRYHQDHNTNQYRTRKPSTHTHHSSQSGPAGLQTYYSIIATLMVRGTTHRNDCSPHVIPLLSLAESMEGWTHSFSSPFMLHGRRLPSRSVVLASTREVVECGCCSDKVLFS